MPPTIAARRLPYSSTTNTTATTILRPSQYHSLFRSAAARARRAGSRSQQQHQRTPPTTPTPPPTTMAAAEPGSGAPPLSTPADWQEYHARWDSIWRDGCAPGQMFDKASASPTLRTLLSLPLLPAQAAHLAASGGLPTDANAYTPPPVIDARGKRALVPGCGRGYDVVAFAQAGASAAVGLELSAKAATVAREYVSAQLQKEGPEGAAARARIVECDFFAPPAAEVPPESFDLGYDLTFLCALHPSMREAWAEGWARLLKPGGLLITACYPIDASRDQNSGPPWPLTPQLYERLLLGGGGGEGGGGGQGGESGGSGGSGGKFRKVYLAPVPPGMSHPERVRQEWLGLWERI